MYYIFLSYLFLIGIFYYYNKKFKNINNLISHFFKYILYILSYEIENIDLNSLPSKLIIIGSHTSVYDFIIGVFFYYGYLHEKYDTYVLMKKEFEMICKPFLYFFDNRFKLISIDSSKKNIGVTEQICKSLNDKDNYILSIAPEGTRRCTDKIKSGYWYISKNLNINIIYIGIDFSNKSIILEKVREPEDNWEDEQNKFINSCKKYVPLYPERCYWTKNFY